MNKNSLTILRIGFLCLALLLFFISVPVTPAQAQGTTYTYPVITNNFTPDVIPSGGTSVLTLILGNSNSFPVYLSSIPAALSEELPAGVYFGDPVNVTTDCGITVTTIGTTISLYGGVIPAVSGENPGTCTITMNVTSTAAGSTFIFTIPEEELVATDSTGTIELTNETPTDATIQVRTVQPPSLSKSFNPNTQSVGASSRLSITIRNNDLNYALHEVTLTDHLPANVEIFSTPSVSFTNCGSSVSATDASDGSLGSGDTAIKIVDAEIPANSSCVVRVYVTSFTAGAYTNTIPAYSIHSREGVTNATAASAQVNFQVLGLTKAFSVGNMQVGGTTTMTITLNNFTSGESYTNISLTDTLPTGLVPSATPALATTCTSGSVSYNSTNNSISLTGGTLNAGGSCTITVNLTASVAGTYTNVIPARTLSTAEGATNVTAVSASVTTYASGLGVTAASKTFSPSSIELGGTSRLSISFRAPGDTSLTNFAISDTLPIGVVIASTPNATKSTYCQGGTISAPAGGSTVSWTGGTVPATRTCTIAVNVTSNAPGSYLNTISPANISNAEGRTMSSNISATLYVSGISVAKAYYPDVVNINGLSTLTITLENDNTSQIDNAAFADTLGTGVEIASPSNAYTNCGSGAVLSAPEGGKTFSLSGGTIPASVGGVSGICTVVFDVKGTVTGSWSNTIAAGDLTGLIHGTTTTVANPSAVTDTLTVADLTINVNKSFSPNTVFGGAASTLTLTLSNPNNAVLTGVALADTFPAGMYIAAPANPTTTCGGMVTAVPDTNTFSFSGGTIAANDECYITVQTTMNVINTLTNTIPIGAVTTTNGAENEEQVEASLGNLTMATLYKTFYESPITVGETTIMRIAISNVGSIPLTGLGFVDTMPAGLTPVLPLTESQCNGGTVTYDGGTNELRLTDGSLGGNDSCYILVEVTVAAEGDYENCLEAGALTNDQEVTNASGTCSTLTGEPPLALESPEIDKVFSPDTITADEHSVLTFTITNPNPTETLTGVSFSDTLPAGTGLYSEPNPSQCNGEVSYDSGTNTVSFSGGSIDADDSCTIVVGVSGTAGVYNNTTSEVTSTNGGTGNTASDTLTIIAPPEITKQFSPDTIVAGEVSTLIFTISNPNPAVNPVDLEDVEFSDSLPTGVQVAATPNINVTDCGSAYTFAPSSGDTTLSFSGGVVAVGTDCVITVDVTSVIGGEYVNTTGVVSSSNGGTGNTASDTLTVSGPGLSLVKTHTTASYSAAGDIITYSYLVTNTGDVAIDAPITITDDHFASSFVCSSDALDVGASVTCTADYTVTAGDVTDRSVTNTAYATGSVAGVDVISNESSTTVNYASLSLVKTTTTVSFHVAGNRIYYTYTLTNNGNTTLYAPYTIVDDHFGTNLTCTATAALPVGGVMTCTRTYTVTATDVTDRYVTNTAYAIANDSGGNSIYSNNSSVTVYKVDAPVIAKSFADAMIIAGETTTLTFTITNPVDNVVSLTGVGFTDILPSGMTVVTPILTSQCGGTVALTNSDRTITLSGGSILAGSYCTVSVDVTVDAGGTYVNTSGSVGSTNGGTGNTATDTLDAVEPAVITKAFDPIAINEDGVSTLTFTITNPGVNPITLTGVGFSDTFPVGLIVADPANVDITDCGSSPTFSASTGSGSVSLSNASIDAGGSCVISVDVTAGAGIYENTTGVVTSTEAGDGLTSNTATLEVLTTLDLAITKTDGNESVDRGEELTYTIVVTNDSSIDANGATVTDNFPSTLTDISWTCDAGSGGASCTASGTGNISDSVDLPVGESVTYTVTATVVEDATTNIVNTATVIPPAGLVDVNEGNNKETDTDYLNRLTLTKEVAAEHTEYLELDEEVTYTYTLTNNGTSILYSPFTVSDDQIGDPKGTAFTCGTVEELAPGESTTCTATYIVSLADLDAGSVTNIATAYGFDEDLDEVVSNEATQTIGADQIPQIGLAKEAISIETFSVGTYDVTLRILIGNYGNVTLHDISATDDLNDTFAVPVGHEETVFTVLSITGDGTLTVNSSYDGDTDTELLDTGNTLIPDQEGTVTIVIRVIPTTYYYENSVVGTALSPADEETTDISQDGSVADADLDGDVTDDNEPTPINFGADIFDPPTGVKTFNAAGEPIITWTMVWINNANIVGLHASVHDPIPEGSTYLATGAASGYDVPVTAPAGSTNVGITCTSSGETATELCYYEGSTVAYPLGRIIWEGTIGPDFGVTDPDLTENALTITFSVTADAGVHRLYNRATIDVDRNGDGDFDDDGEVAMVTVSRAWAPETSALPETGFPPYRQTILPVQPSLKAFTDLGNMWLEIPSLDVKTTIVGVPWTEDGWDITWLGDQAGWLNGTAFPTWSGDSVITGHVYNSEGQPGPFINLDKLKYGDKIIIHAYGQQYIYEVRETEQVDAYDVNEIQKHEDVPWVTLMTCQGYDPVTNTYRYRYLVRAVQVEIK